MTNPKSPSENKEIAKRFRKRLLKLMQLRDKKSGFVARPYGVYFTNNSFIYDSDIAKALYEYKSGSMDSGVL